ncbi:hypothetical protein Hanom_Chr11g00988961 [Helianthus anomalus]
MHLHVTNSIINLYILASVSLSQIKSCFSVYLLVECHCHLSRRQHQIGHSSISDNQNFTLKPWICATSLPPLILIIIASPTENQVINLSFISSHNHTLLTSYNCLMILTYRADPSLGSKIFQGP